MLATALIPTILITGGAGYIGSHTALYMAQKGYNVIVLDTYRHGQKTPETFHKITLDRAQGLPGEAQRAKTGLISVINSDFADEAVLSTIFSNHDIHAVMHFAALIEVGESVKNPRAFYNNNVVKTIKLLECMLDHGIKKFIFSSSCAVYGTPQKLPLTEDHQRTPISPYGNNKMMVELALEDFHAAYGLEYVSLRYFNAAGAMPEYGLGEQHVPETHLIPILLRAVHENRPFYIFGSDYPTKDGSCVRDYLHVWDLAQAHWLALEHLNQGNGSDYFNLGTGDGFSVKEMIDAVQKVCGKSINVIAADRRAGDPAVLVADKSKACNILGWQPQHSNLECILETANTFYVQMKTGKFRTKEKPSAAKPEA